MTYNSGYEKYVASLNGYLGRLIEQEDCKIIEEKIMDSRIDESKVIWNPAKAEHLIGKKVYAFARINGTIVEGVLNAIEDTRVLPFTVSDGICTVNYIFICPMPEPTYAERQKKWVQENNVSVGTKIRFIKNFNDREDGSDCFCHLDVLGKTGVILYVTDDYIAIQVGENKWGCPFTALEVIKDEYRQFNDEEMKALYGKTLLGRHGMPNMVTTVVYYAGNICIEGDKFVFDAEELLKSDFTIDGHKCGVLI